jgi:hypothetical protein
MTEIERTIWLLLFAVGIFLIVLAMTYPARSHSWYPPECCNGRDCYPVPCDEISNARERGMDGYRWIGVRQLRKYLPNDLFFSKQMHRYSADGACHVCVSYGQTKTAIPRCIFTPAPVQS